LREAVFYALRNEKPEDCRLEQLRYVVRASDGVYDALMRTIGAALDETYARPVSFKAGDAKERELDDRATEDTDYPSDRWRDPRAWTTPTRTIVLYRLDDTVQVLMQTDILQFALRHDGDDHTSDLRYGVALPTWNLINRLRPIDPEAADLILGGRVLNQGRLERALLRLLQRRARASDRLGRDTFGHAASMLAPSLRVEGRRPQEARPSLKPLLAFGVSMEESAYDPGIWYGYYNPASRRARVPDVDGTFQYRDVIQSSLAAVRTRPGRVRPSELFALAEAYETWWSLSLAPDDEELVTRSDHQSGAANARLQAIKWYDQLIRRFPYSREAERARRVIIQIRLGVDTGQRADFSPYA
jgi:hypothetical protein